eukprot:TRINITY_DN14429_c0_g1_i1.p1 TRINITY_DN14429_c0_g1~~TRINITY_DN14429_c0_g1_i1.p1  ORF type:complete len:117 (-),score=48.74 TRINITY_DN14429_c0_g1_i1:33-383(-)
MPKRKTNRGKKKGKSLDHDKWIKMKNIEKNDEDMKVEIFDPEKPKIVKNINLDMQDDKEEVDNDIPRVKTNNKERAKLKEKNNRIVKAMIRKDKSETKMLKRNKKSSLKERMKNIY